MPRETKETRIAEVQCTVIVAQTIAISEEMRDRVKAGDEAALRSVATKLHARFEKQYHLPGYVDESSIVILRDFPRKRPAAQKSVQPRLRGMSKAGKRGDDAKG